VGRGHELGAAARSGPGRPELRFLQRPAPAEVDPEPDLGRHLHGADAHLSVALRGVGVADRQERPLLSDPSSR
jgi:hypothetical protein